MKLKEYLESVKEATKDLNTPVELIICVDQEMNIVEESYNQIKLTINNE